VHIEPAGKPRWSRAARALNALSVGRLDMVRAFRRRCAAGQAGLLRAAAGGIQNTHRTLPRLSDKLRLNDAGLKALLNDWLEGVYTRQPGRGAGERAS
jgi:chromosome segregation protein